MSCQAVPCRRIYGLLSESSQNSQLGEEILALESENKRLKEVVLKLYSSSQEEKKASEQEIAQLKKKLRDIENHERSELSERCAAYHNEVLSLRVRPFR